MVLADGRLVHANAKENKDLFWAVRGGGGNFGVVTAFEYRLHPISQVYGGPMIWPLEKSGEVLRWWRDFILKAPEDINGWFGFLNVPPAAPFPEAYHGKKAVGIVWCYSGPMEKAEERFKPIRAFGPPAIDFVGQVPWPALQSMFDALYPAGLQWYWKADFFKELTDKAIDLHVKHGSQLPSFHSTMHLYPINGAAHRPAPGDTAFSFRDAHFAQVIVGVDPDPANNPKLTEWAKNHWLALHPHSAGGAYVNMIMDEGEETVKSAYRDNYPRLAEIKAKYDPGNLFRSNQNIKPSR
jgi:FAD/FMN-containing dehydrogenase